LWVVQQETINETLGRRGGPACRGRLPPTHPRGMDRMDRRPLG
jgi:hypothetical protein